MGNICSSVFFQFLNIYNLCRSICRILPKIICIFSAVYSIIPLAWYTVENHLYFLLFISWVINPISLIHYKWVQNFLVTIILYILSIFFFWQFLHVPTHRHHIHKRSLILYNLLDPQAFPPPHRHPPSYHHFPIQKILATFIYT